MTTTTFPDGSTLTSSALTPDTLLLILQPLTCGMLGVIPPNYYNVRLDWQQAGQPAFLITDDICSLRAVEQNEPYSKIRDLGYVPDAEGFIHATYTYVRTWRVSFTNYGPNCSDRARLLVDALFLDWTTNVLAGSQLALVTDIDRPVYLKELKDGQWWARCDLHVDFNELVTASIQAPVITSVEVLVEMVTGRPPATRLVGDFRVG